MITLLAQKRAEIKRKVRALRKQGKIPAILYGPQLKSTSLLVEKKVFEKVFQEVGESSLFTLEVEGENIPVLIHGVQHNPLSGEVVHVDFYQPPLNKKIEIMVPLVLEGQPPAVRDLGGTLIRNIQQVLVSAFPQDLPHEIRVNAEGLSTFEDRIVLRDLAPSEKVSILGNPEDIVAQVIPPEKVEEELAKPIEEKIEEVTKIEKEKKAEEAIGEETSSETQTK